MNSAQLPICGRFVAARAGKGACVSCKQQTKMPDVKARGVAPTEVQPRWLPQEMWPLQAGITLLSHLLIERRSV